MSVGNPSTPQSLNQRLGQVTVQMRSIMEAAADLVKVANGLGSGGLQAIGFSSADATSFLQMTGYLSTVAGIYYGTVQQGGSGGTGASLFNFDNALSVTWGSQ